VSGARPEVVLLDEEPGRALIVDGRRHALPERSHPAYLDLWETLAAEAGLRPPAARRAPELPPDPGVLKPILTRPLSPDIRYGYGDPSVIRILTADGPSWRLVVTSNDAEAVFPLLRSDDLVNWTPSGCVFPPGQAPSWCLTGEDQADFWAPEMHKVGEEYWLVFAARRQDGELAIGLARSDAPDGPFVAGDRPLLDGGVIDPHVLIDRNGSPLLVWKTDSNHLWPLLMSRLLAARPGLIDSLFDAAEDRRAAALVSALLPWTEAAQPMEQFFLQQPLIEAVTAAFAEVRRRLAAEPEAGPILEAMKTRIFGRPIAPDGLSLTGEPTLLVENDQDWEAHLIEGAWVSEHEGRYYLFYAGNDFSTPHYAIGAAVADEPLGPYRKEADRLLASTRSWWGPGHPSVTRGPDGRHMMILHAFRPGEAGYKAFRAMLMAAVELRPDGVKLSPP
jgi:hypothetical protein